jgi:hypothetical protein
MTCSCLERNGGFTKFSRVQAHQIDVAIVAGWLGSEIALLKIANQRKKSSANPLRTLRTAWSLPQRASSRSASADFRSSSGLSNRLLVVKTREDS